MQGRAVAVADKDERAGPRLEHEREVLRPHGRRRIRIDIAFARDLARDARREVGLSAMIDGRWIAAAILDARARSARFGQAGGDLVDPLFDPIAGLWLERADR